MTQVLDSGVVLSRSSCLCPPTSGDFHTAPAPPRDAALVGLAGEEGFVYMRKLGVLISPEDGHTFQERVLPVAAPTLGKEEHWEVTCEAELETGRSMILPFSGKLWTDRTHLSSWVPQPNRGLGLF